LNSNRQNSNQIKSLRFDFQISKLRSKSKSHSESTQSIRFESRIIPQRNYRRDESTFINDHRSEDDNILLRRTKLTDDLLFWVSISQYFVMKSELIFDYAYLTRNFILYQSNLVINSSSTSLIDDLLFWASISIKLSTFAVSSSSANLIERSFSWNLVFIKFVLLRSQSTSIFTSYRFLQVIESIKFLTIQQFFEKSEYSCNDLHIHVFSWS
jgi:hypothetical protein